MDQNILKRDIGEGYYCYRDENYFYIIDKNSHDAIWREEISGEKLPEVEMIGLVRDQPVFWDSAHENYILPTFKAGHREYFSLIRPVVINGDNIVNIVEDQSGLGIVDFANPTVIKPKYDKIKLELKVTLEDETRVREEYYPIPGGTFVSNGK